jgi:2-keto-4-pentenoate hydratase/2-oxohepta-3-ene-1,7-dioic acid hydratase in catechol pathway
MKWVSYRTSDGSPRVGLVQDERILGHRAGLSLLDVLRSAGGLTATAAALESDPSEVVDLSTAELLAPIVTPPAVRNFAAFERHVSNSSRVATGNAAVSPAWYRQPVFFFSNPAVIHGPYEDVSIPSRTTAWDYEVEVAAVIAEDCSDLKPETAEQHIAGYLIYCDWSARDLSSDEMGFPYGPSKSKDSATTLGPYLVTNSNRTGPARVTGCA